MRTLIFVFASLAAAPAIAANPPASAASLSASSQAASSQSAEVACPAFLDREFRRLHSPEKVNLCRIAAGRPVLIVNTASHCGYTSQFKGLEALHQKYRERGLVVIGFPSDSFNQESADAAETAEVCYVNYGVKFTMLEATAVKGADANPVFRELARQTREPSWNFNKYLLTREGKVVQHFGSSVAPDSRELAAAIERAL